MKKKYPIFYLLDILVEIFIYVIVIELGARLDEFLFGPIKPVEEGGRYPYLTLIILIAATIALAVMIVVSVVTFVKKTIQNNKKKKSAQ